MDTDKPVSSATATALSNKVDKVAGKQLSTEDYTSGEKAKLASVADGAEVNVQADWNAVTGDAEILNKPNLSIYAETSNVLAKNNTEIYTPDTDYNPATKKYVDDNLLAPAGGDGAIQFNDAGVLGGVAAFSYDRVSGAITIGETVEILPNVPLAIEKDIDDYVQITLQNKSNDVSASMDLVITADNGTDETHYLDMGVNSSQYSDAECPVLKANDGYIYTSDDDLSNRRTGIMIVNQMFADKKLFISSNCVNLIKELESHYYKEGGKRDGEVNKVNDDLLDALRYLIFNIKKNNKG